LGPEQFRALFVRILEYGEAHPDKCFIHTIDDALFIEVFGHKIGCRQSGLYLTLINTSPGCNATMQFRTTSISSSEPLVNRVNTLIVRVSNRVFEKSISDVTTPPYMVSIGPIHLGRARSIAFLSGVVISTAVIFCHLIGLIQ